MKIKFRKWNGKLFTLGFFSGLVIGSVSGGLAFLILLNLVPLK